MTVIARIYNRHTGSLVTRQVEWSDFRRQLVKAGLVQDETLPALWVSDDFIVRVIKK